MITNIWGRYKQNRTLSLVSRLVSGVVRPDNTNLLLTFHWQPTDGPPTPTDAPLMLHWCSTNAPPTLHRHSTNAPLTLHQPPYQCTPTTSTDVPPTPTNRPTNHPIAVECRAWLVEHWAQLVECQAQSVECQAWLVECWAWLVQCWAQLVEHWAWSVQHQSHVIKTTFPTPSNRPQ